MPNKTEKDLWIEMSIREIWTQAHFAGIAYSHIEPKAANSIDTVFSSIHSFLSHCAMVSKMLAAEDDEHPPKYIGDILGIPRESLIHQRVFRNHLEHYDERLKGWIRKFGVNTMIGTYNIGPKSAFQIPGMILVRHYDPDSQIFTFVNDDFDLDALSVDVKRTKSVADKWVKDMESGVITPPFG